MAMDTLGVVKGIAVPSKVGRSPNWAAVVPIIIGGAVLIAAWSGSHKQLRSALIGSHPPYDSNATPSTAFSLYTPNSSNTVTVPNTGASASPPNKGLYRQVESR